MEADWIESQRDQFLSRREKRWSMNSQRLEEIVAELMKPISTDQRTFDTDLSALLEEYLTEAGLHALDAAEESGGADFIIPNFAEIALLLQQSVTIYSRKVDFLYQHVLNVSDSLHNNTQEVTEEEGESVVAPSTPGSERRRRRASAALLTGFEEIEVERGAGTLREPEAPRPPPTLPRMYLELEPRLVTPADVPLFDYAAENIGLLSDFQVAWRLHAGQLVDELQGGEATASVSLRPLSLLELQAAIQAAAPASPPLLRDDSPPRDLSPLHASTPLPPDDSALAVPSRLKRERKRRSEVNIDDVFSGTVKIVIGKDLMRQLKEVREFSISEGWIASVVAERKSRILSERKRLHEEDRPEDEGFAGWSCLAAARARAVAQRARDPDSDDDGFFEQSSGGLDRDTLETLVTALAAPAAAREAAPVAAAEAAREAVEPAREAVEPAREAQEPAREAGQAAEEPAREAREAGQAAEEPARAAGQAAEEPARAAERAAAEAVEAAWRASAARAAAAAARGAPDVGALGRRVLRALGGGAALRVTCLLRAEARDPTDVSRLLLASLFLANAGNVEIVPGPALALNSFSLRLLSRELRRRTLAAADAQLGR